MDEFTSTEWGAESDAPLPEKFWEELPKPLYWRVLVMPIKPRAKSRGGIHIPLSSQEEAKYMNYMGRVIALGDMAGKSERLGAYRTGERAPNFPAPGEHIVYGRYSGQKVTYKGVQLLWINDDEILGVVPNPETLQVHI